MIELNCEEDSYTDSEFKGFLRSSGYDSYPPWNFWTRKANGKVYIWIIDGGVVNSFLAGDNKKADSIHGPNPISILSEASNSEEDDLRDEAIRIIDNCGLRKK